MNREVPMPDWRVWLAVIVAVWIALGGVAGARDGLAVSRPGEQQPLGLFVHYGPSTNVNASSAVGWWREMAYGNYGRAVAAFRPKATAADGWIALAQRAEASYVAVTAKHHDGYTLWHSDTTSYGVPADQDILARAALDARRAGLGLVVYFSLIDLHEKSYTNDWAAYERLVREQLRELMTRYGKITGVWFDGPGWARLTQPYAAWQMPELYALIHHYQPGAEIITNHHFGQPLPSEGAVTYESEMPKATAAWPQQAVFSISPQWFYSTHDRPMTHQAYLALKAQARALSTGLLINVPPRADGSFDPAYVRALLGQRK